MNVSMGEVKGYLYLKPQELTPSAPKEASDEQDLQKIRENIAQEMEKYRLIELNKIRKKGFRVLKLQKNNILQMNDDMSFVLYEAFVKNREAQERFTELELDNKCFCIK